MLFGLFGPKKSSYAYKKSRKIAKMQEKLAVLRIKKEIETLEATSELDQIDKKADKVGKINDLVAEIEDLKEQLQGPGAEMSPIMQFLNSPIGMMAAQKILGIKLDLTNPQSREAATEILLQKAQENPELVAKGLKQAKKMGLIGNGKKAA